MKRKAIHKRGLTSFFTLFGFLIMSITGLVLYIVPQGRIAYWVNWKLIDLTKTDWGNIHILSSIFFIVAGAFHIYFNWKPLMNYFKDKISKGVRLKWELAISLAVAIIIVISSLYNIPPLKYLIDLNEYIKDAWITSEEYEPPFGHAELLSLQSFSKKMKIDLEKAVNELQSKGIKIESVENSLEDISQDNGISPMGIYMIIKKFEVHDESSEIRIYTPEIVDVEFSGIGIGNRTLSSICNKANVDISVAEERLLQNGIEIKADEKLKKASEKYNLEPLDILKIILIEDYKIDK